MRVMYVCVFLHSRSFWEIVFCGSFRYVRWCVSPFAEFLGMSPTPFFADPVHILLPCIAEKEPATMVADEATEPAPPAAAEDSVTPEVDAEDKNCAASECYCGVASVFTKQSRFRACGSGALDRRGGCCLCCRFELTAVWSLWVFTRGFTPQDGPQGVCACVLEQVLDFSFIHGLVCHSCSLTDSEMCPLRTARSQSTYVCHRQLHFQRDKTSKRCQIPACAQSNLSTHTLHLHDLPFRLFTLF